MKKFIFFIFSLIIILFLISSCVNADESSVANSANSNITSSNSGVESSEATAPDPTTPETSVPETSEEELADPHKVNAGKSELAPVLELPIGDGDGEIGYVIVEKGGLNWGPDSFKVAPDGAIMILDGVNERIVTYRDKKQVESVDISFCETPPMEFAFSDE